MSKLKKKHINIYIPLLIILIFVFFVVFYTKIHPICLLDTDDYGYAFYHRSAIPIWGKWNPARVLPETLFGFVSEFGAFVVFPIVGDLFYSETLSYALTVSFFIVFFAFQLTQFLKIGGVFRGLTVKKSDIIACCGTIWFFLFCFWIFRRGLGPNHYLLNTRDACCFFYYVIPNLLNGGMLLWYIRYLFYQKTHEGHKLNRLVIPFIIIGFYFAFLGDDWSCCMIAGYSGARILIDCIRSLTSANRNTVRQFIKEHRLDLLFVFIFVGVNIFELSGGRSSQQATGSLGGKLEQTWAYLKALYVENANMACLISIAVFIIDGLIIGGMYKKRREFNTLQCYLALAGLFCLAYSFLTCSIIDPLYITSFLYNTNIGSSQRKKVDKKDTSE